jgi:hypothetical protein
LVFGPSDGLNRHVLCVKPNLNHSQFNGKDSDAGGVCDAYCCVWERRK